LVNALLFRALTAQDPLEAVTLLSRFYLISTIGEAREVAAKSLRIATVLRLVDEVPRHPLSTMPAGGYAHRIVFCPINKLSKEDLDFFGLKPPEGIERGVPEPKFVEFKADFTLKSLSLLLEYMRLIMIGGK